MPTLLARIAPQRSTLYAALATALAGPEWQISPLAEAVDEIQSVTVGGAGYLQLTLNRELADLSPTLLGLLAMTTEFYEFFAELGGLPGPFLRPLAIPAPAYVPEEIVVTRRYRGKTNELFTRFLLNAAYFGSDFVQSDILPHLSVLDPLCGGGTTLLQALVYGWDGYGLDHDKSAISTTDGFLRQYLRDARVRFQQRQERVRGLGDRYRFTLDPKGDQPRRCVLAQADTTQAAQAVDGVKVHLIVADLPYGVQHQGQLATLLTQGLPQWLPLLRPGGAMALAWESTRFPRDEMVQIVQECTGVVGHFVLLDSLPHRALAHPVDRVIKERDVIVVKKLV